MSGTTWTLEDDLNTVTVSFATNPPVALKLNASYVEDMLKNLGEFRALKQPVVPSDWTLSQQVQAIPNPRWFAEPEMMLGNTVLHLRDPRFGWLHYMIPRETARQLGELLIWQADAPPPGPPQEKPN